MDEVTSFGLLHVDRIDVTGYTRLTVVETGPYAQLICTAEWFVFDEALPEAAKQRAPLPMPYRIF